MITNEKVYEPSEMKESIFIEPLSANILKDENDSGFKKRLIACVRKYKILYDSRDKNFSNIEKKEKIWIQIGERLTTNSEVCQNVWADLRYQYQRYVRRLRKFLRYSNKQRKRRPVMAFETEMLFLYRYISDRSLGPIPYLNSNTKETNTDEDDDIVILDDEPEVIVLDDEEKPAAEVEKSTFKLTAQIRKLLELIEAYPELYDTKNAQFHDHRRKGIIWSAIANECNDKATKLMKYWIQLQTRFEWEVTQRLTPITDPENDIRHVMGFLQPYILLNLNTVYKQSYYLKYGWHEPIDHFKNIYSLLNTLKKFPSVINETEKQLLRPNKLPHFDEIWKTAKLSFSSPGGYETTWLILRSFYLELIHMRNHGYQLQDKWYFETMIADVFASAKKLLIQENNNFVPLRTGPIQMKSNPLIEPPSADTVKNILTQQHAANKINANLTQQIKTPIIVSAQSLAPQLNATNNDRPVQLAKGLQIKAIGNTTIIRNTQQTATQMPTSVMTEIPKITQAATLVPPVPIPQPVNIAIRMPIPIPQLQQPPASATAPAPPPTITQLIGPYTKLNTLNLSTMSIPLNTTPARITTYQTNLPAMSDNGNVIPPTPTPSKSSSSSSTSSISSSSSTPPLQSTITTTVQRPPTPTQTPPIQAIENNAPSTSNPPLVILNSKAPGNATANQIVHRPIINSIQNTPSSDVPLKRLSSNEIMIELISTPNGNLLVVHGPPLMERYTLTMETTAAFIREIMALPLIHNKTHSQGSRVQGYWVYLSAKFNLPAHICRAIWNFLSENFEHFPQIAPLDELMKPFHSEAKGWQEGTKLFERFYAKVSTKGWLAYEHKFPVLMERIGKHRALYQDLARYSDVQRAASFEKVKPIWRTLRKEFMINEVEEIWAAFKSIFWQYMNELEMSFENHWPLWLWRSFAKLDFLINQRYHQMEPFYYIVRNKFNEEIERCRAMEGSTISNAPSETIVNTPQTVTVMHTTPSEKPNIYGYNLLAAIRRYPQIYLKSTITEKAAAWSQVAKELNTTPILCRRAFKHSLRNYRIYLLRDPANRYRLNSRYYNHMHAIYRSMKSSKKINIKTPNEVNQSVTDAPESNETVIPERMIFDINMDNSDTTLVMKNWSCGIGKCSLVVQNTLPAKIHELFSKYEAFREQSET